MNAVRCTYGCGIMCGPKAAESDFILFSTRNQKYPVHSIQYTVSSTQYPVHSIQYTMTLLVVILVPQSQLAFVLFPLSIFL